MRIKQLSYPSSSAIVCVDARFYIMGDDARNLVILNTELEEIDSIALYHSNERRIPKPAKGDIEAGTITADNKLLLVGSGSLPPHRNGGWLIDPAAARADSFRLDTIYGRIMEAGLTMLNIEGACTLPGFILLANRGNNAWRKNHLILLADTFLNAQHTAGIQIVELSANNKGPVFVGVSGMDHHAKSDELIITASTENTSSNTGDGAIGKSYLWVIRNFSSKQHLPTIRPDIVIDLEDLDKRFHGLKIESVCVIRKTNVGYYIALVADNDDGNSTVITTEIPVE
jgi:hypothetical protein